MQTLFYSLLNISAKYRKIDLYNFELYRFKVGLFWDTVYMTYDEDMRETIFYIFVLSDLDLDLWPLDLKCAPLFTLVQRYVSTKLNVSIRLPISKTGGTGHTDRETYGQLHHYNAYCMRSTVSNVYLSNDVYRNRLQLIVRNTTIKLVSD